MESRQYFWLIDCTWTMLEWDVSFKISQDEIHVMLYHLSLVDLTESKQGKFINNFLEWEFSVKYHLCLFINLEWSWSKVVKPKLCFFVLSKCKIYSYFYIKLPLNNRNWRELKWGARNFEVREKLLLWRGS